MARLTDHLSLPSLFRAGGWAEAPATSGGGRRPRPQAQLPAPWLGRLLSHHLVGLAWGPRKPLWLLSLPIHKQAALSACSLLSGQRTWYARDILAYWLLARPSLSPSLRLKWKEEASQLWHFQFLPSFSSVIFYQGVSFLCVTKVPA